jgi:hypothetical protein
LGGLTPANPRWSGASTTSTSPTSGSPKATSTPKAGEEVVLATHNPQVDVLGRPGTPNSQLEDETALERHDVSEHRDDASQKPIEDEELPTACELRSISTGGDHRFAVSRRKPSKRR